MASKRATVPAKHLFNGFRSYEQPTRCFTRSMATATESAPIQDPLTPPNATVAKAYADAHLDAAPTQSILEDKVSVPPPTPAPASIQRAQPFQPAQNPFRQKAQCTLYNFPTLEPTSFVLYPDTHLLLPIRKDILHRAVIFEGDATRQGTASTKWRSEVHGSNRKVRPQKGTGSARLGNKKSPMLKGGGVAFGPKPRDFSTELPQKLYDRAWRTALSYRYKKGELIVAEDVIDVQGIHENSLERYMDDLLRWNNIGNHGEKKHGRSLFLTLERREGLYSALEQGQMYRHAKAIEAEWVDVKDLLEGGRVIVERAALEHLFEEHESDLREGEKLRYQMPELYEEIEIV
ncbi:putative ribosomal protein L4/L1e [Septoria linicola]|nr:putative ribosomal protein L4/L1e [Septoria linicola]